MITAWEAIDPAARREVNRTSHAQDMIPVQ
jgi:hypothetical protein